MALSNTATPKYYGEFRDKVLRREIPVCEEISMEMNRIDELIKHPGIFYDDNAVEGWVAFCENEMTLTDGSPIHLLDSFKLWGEQVFGWYYFIEKSVYDPKAKHGEGGYVRKRVKKRLINKQYLIVGRGAAKSLYDTMVQAYSLCIKRKRTHQITTAPTMRQSEEVMDPFRTALVRRRGPYFEFMTEGSLNNTTGSSLNRPKLLSTKKGIQNLLTNSLLEVRPMSIDKLQGLRPDVSTVDEWLSGDVREDVIGPLEQGATKLDDWLIIASSSEGTVRNSTGDTMKMELRSILKGEYKNPHVSIFWYKLDSIKEVNEPDKWVKANPNIGKTVSYEAIQLDVERAENAPATRNDILAKRFGIPMEGFTYFFTYDETKKHRHHSYMRMRCSMGCDLSQGDDFCAFTFLFPLRNDCYGIKTRSYITEQTYNNLSNATREKYDDFIREDTLVVMDGSVLDLMDVYDDLYQCILRHQYQVVTVGYDPYYADEFIKRWGQENGHFGIEMIKQGKRTESVPLGELKHLSEDGKLIFDEDLMSFAMGNCIVEEDTNGNIKLWKKRRRDKIDNVAAMMDAYIAYKRNRDAFE